MSARTRKYLIIAAVVLGFLVLLCVLVIPRLVDVNSYRPQIAAYLESQTGKPARIGRLQLTLFPHLAIQVDDFALGNPKGFPSGDFFKTQRIYALLQAGPLWDKKIVVQSLIVEDPVIHLLSNTAGHWNYENPPSPGNDKPATPSSGEPGFSLGTISSVRINGGQATIANLLPSGTMGPTYFDGKGLSCQFQDVNLNALSSSNSSSSASAGPSRIVPAADNHSTPVAHGSFHADSLRFGAIQATSVNSQIQVFPKQAYLDNLNLKFAGGTVTGKAASDFSHPNLLYSAQTAFQKLDVAQILNAFPSASGKMTGTMEGSLDLNGEAAHSSDPLSGMQGTGKVSIRNGRLPTLQLNKNLLFLARMAGVGSTSGDPASFTSISTDLNLASQQLTSHHVTIVSTDLNVDASGVVGVAAPNQMNYIGTALMPARQGGLTNLVAGISGATFANGKLSFPFELQGTLDNPKFSLKTGKGVLGGLSGAPASGAGQGAQPGNAIQNLFNMFQKKKSTTTPPK
jgi:uncharacterized protein involved in outer membrane biogenesis